MNWKSMGRYHTASSLANANQSPPSHSAIATLQENLRGRREPRVTTENSELGTELLPLLLRREIPLARPHLQIFLQRGNFNRAISSVRIKIGGLVRDDVLAAQLVFDRGERVGNVLHLEWKKNTSAGGLGQLFQHLVAAHHQAA